MKKTTLLAALFALFALLPRAEAQGGNIGIGLVGEDPSGLTLKYRMSSQQALDFRLGISFLDDGAFEFQVNYLVSPFLLTSGSGFNLPFYVGIGGEIFFFDRGRNDFLALLGRVPIGVAMELTSVPIDIFLEVAPKLLIIPGLAVDIDGAIGIRYFF